MRVFVTGGSGAIGKAVVAELVKQGHVVNGLARSEKSLAVVKNLGATPIKGAIEDLHILEREAGQTDAIVSTLYDRSLQTDRRTDSHRL